MNVTIQNKNSIPYCVIAKNTCILFALQNCFNVLGGTYAALSTHLLAICSLYLENFNENLTNHKNDIDIVLSELRPKK